MYLFESERKKEGETPSLDKYSIFANYLGQAPVPVDGLDSVFEGELVLTRPALIEYRGHRHDPRVGHRHQRHQHHARHQARGGECLPHLVHFNDFTS